jgi:hypothetical protein
MKRSLLLGVVVAAGVLWIALSRRQSPSVEVKSSPAMPHQVGSPKFTATTREGTDFHATRPQVQAAGVDAATLRTEVYAVIDDASATYDERAVAAIAPYLAHADIEIRKMALDGLLRAGEVTAAPVLRAAAAKLADPRETTTYLDAADYLELPARTSARKNAKKSTAAPPTSK